MANNRFFDLTDGQPNSPYQVPAVVVIDPSTGLPSTSVGLASEATLGQIKTILDAINGNTDLVETLQTNTNTALTTIQGYVDSVEALLTTLGSNTDQVEALLNTLGVNTDQVEALLTDVKAAIQALPQSQALTDTQLRAAPIATSMARAKPVARYVMLARQGNNVDWFVFKDVSVMSGATNVALNKPATAFASNANLPGFAVDGSAATLYSSGTNSGPTTMQWWMVDLGADYTIDKVIIDGTFGANAVSGAYIVMTPASVGPLTSATSVFAAMATPGASTLGPFPSSGAVVEFLASPTSANLELLRASMTLQSTTQTILNSLLPQLGGRLSVEPLSALNLARQLAVTASSNGVAISASIKRVSLYARGCDMRYGVSSGTGTAVTTSGSAQSHFIASGERIDVYVGNLSNANVNAIAVSGTGTLEITELA